MVNMPKNLNTDLRFLNAEVIAFEFFILFFLVSTYQAFRL